MNKKTAEQKLCNHLFKYGLISPLDDIQVKRFEYHGKFIIFKNLKKFGECSFNGKIFNQIFFC